MPLGQKVKVCGRRFPEKDPNKRSWYNYEGLKPYLMDEDRKGSKGDTISGNLKELWCGYFSNYSSHVWLCESCAVENGLKW